MTEWLLSGHNTQEWAGVSRLMSLTAVELGLGESHGHGFL